MYDQIFKLLINALQILIFNFSKPKSNVAFVLGLLSKSVSLLKPLFLFERKLLNVQSSSRRPLKEIIREVELLTPLNANAHLIIHS